MPFPVEFLRLYGGDVIIRAIEPVGIFFIISQRITANDSIYEIVRIFKRKSNLFYRFLCISILEIGFLSVVVTMCSFYHFLKKKSDTPWHAAFLTDHRQETYTRNLKPAWCHTADAGDFHAIILSWPGVSSSRQAPRIGVFAFI